MEETGRQITVSVELRMRIRTLTGQIESAQAEIDSCAETTQNLEARIKDLTALRDEYHAVLRGIRGA